MMLLHFLLLIISSAQIFNINDDTHSYSREQRIAFFRIFLDPEMDVDDIFYDRERTYDDMDEMMQQILASIDFYGNLTGF